MDVEDDGIAPPGETPGLARANGFSLHAGVAVPANDRQRLERLCRYVGRPPVATQRLTELADGRLLYELRHRWRDGTTHVAFEPLELIDRLAALVPPPRFHTVRYHGVLASRSKHRANVVPNDAEPGLRPPCSVGSCLPPSDGAIHPSTRRLGPSDRLQNPLRDPDSTERPAASLELASTRAGSARLDRDAVNARDSRPSRYYSWSELMSRVFAIDVLQCPRCKAGPMRILAAIHPPVTTQAILNALGLPTRAPPIAPAQWTPTDWTLAEPLANRYFAKQGNWPAA